MCNGAEWGCDKYLKSRDGVGKGTKTKETVGIGTYICAALYKHLSNHALSSR